MTFEFVPTMVFGFWFIQIFTGKINTSKAKKHGRKQR